MSIMVNSPRRRVMQVSSILQPSWYRLSAIRATIPGRSCPKAVMIAKWFIGISSVASREQVARRMLQLSQISKRRSDPPGWTCFYVRRFVRFVGVAVSGSSGQWWRGYRPRSSFFTS
jgi:hypothetical protein